MSLWNYRHLFKLRRVSVITMKNKDCCLIRSSAYSEAGHHYTPLLCKHQLFPLLSSWYDFIEDSHASGSILRITLNFLISCCPFPACYKRSQLQSTFTEVPGFHNWVKKKSGLTKRKQSCWWTAAAAND